MAIGGTTDGGCGPGLAAASETKNSEQKRQRDKQTRMTHLSFPCDVPHTPSFAPSVTAFGTDNTPHAFGSCVPPCEAEAASK